MDYGYAQCRSINYCVHETKQRQKMNKQVFDENGKALSIADVMAMLPIIDLLKVNRVEVIDENGRSYVNWKPTNKTSISMQDDGKTLKVFIGN